jgi:hypothetical protein
MAARKNKYLVKVGDVFQVDLSHGRVGFGWVTDSVRAAFFDYSCKKDEAPELEKLVLKPIAFHIWASQVAIERGEWRVVGNVTPPEELLASPWYYKQDKISGAVYLTQTGDEEIPDRDGRYVGLECAAVWAPVHVVTRLEDHFAGRPNQSVALMKVKVVKPP